MVLDGNTLMINLYIKFKTIKTMEYKKILLPDNLSSEAERYIKKVIDWLKSNDKLTAVDEGALRILADSYDQYIKAMEHVNRVGLTVAGSRNTIVANPAVRIAKDAKATCLSLMVEIGLTLKSRSKLTTLNQDTEESPLAEFMKSF